MHADFSKGHKASPCLSCKLITSDKNYHDSSLQGHINSNANPKLKNNPRQTLTLELQKRGLCVELAELFMMFIKIEHYQIMCISGHNFTLLPYSSLKLTCNRLRSRGYMLERGTVCSLHKGLSTHRFGKHGVPITVQHQLAPDTVKR